MRPPGVLSQGLEPRRMSPAQPGESGISGFLKILVSTWRDSNYSGIMFNVVRGERDPGCWVSSCESLAKFLSFRIGSIHRRLFGKSWGFHSLELNTNQLRGTHSKNLFHWMESLKRVLNLSLARMKSFSLLYSIQNKMKTPVCGIEGGRSPATPQSDTISYFDHPLLLIVSHGLSQCWPLLGLIHVLPRY